MESEPLLAQDSAKKPVERSVSYPGINLQEAERLAGEVSKHFGFGISVSREDIAAILKVNIHAISRPVAATVQFGFLIRERDRYRLSQKFKDLANPISEDERKRMLISAFQSPRLYGELIEKHDGRTVPLELRTHLLRFHNIASNASEAAAQIFIESARYAGVLTETNVLKVTERYNELSGIDPREIPAPDVGGAPPVNDTHQEAEQPPPLPPPNRSAATESPPSEIQYLEHEVKVTEKKRITLLYPETLTAKDFRILKKGIDLLAESMDIDLEETK